MIFATPERAKRKKGKLISKTCTAEVLLFSFDNTKQKSIGKKIRLKNTNMAVFLNLF